MDATRAELDYAFFAQWAKVSQEGTLTAIDASFLRMITDLNTVVPFALAGRIRFPKGVDEANLELLLVEANLQLNITQLLKPEANTAYGDGFHHALFALNTSIPTLEYGKVTARISIDGTEVRTLMFELVPRPEA